MLCAVVVPVRRNHLCIICFRNEQILASIGNGGLATTRFLLTCRSLHFLFVSDLRFAPPLSLQGLMILLVHTNRATQEVQPFNDSTNSTLHDSEPLRYRDQTHMDEGLASIQTWKDPRPGSRCLHAFHLFVGASKRVFWIEYAQRLRPWTTIWDEWTDLIRHCQPRKQSSIALTLRANNRLRHLQKWKGRD